MNIHQVLDIFTLYSYINDYLDNKSQRNLALTCRSFWYKDLYELNVNSTWVNHLNPILAMKEQRPRLKIALNLYKCTGITVYQPLAR